MAGVRFITSFDDDLLLVGDPRGFQKWSIYIVFEVESLDSVVAMVDDFRQGDPRLHTYFTLQATLGTRLLADRGGLTKSLKEKNDHHPLGFSFEL